MNIDYEVLFSASEGVAVRTPDGRFPVLTAAQAARRLGRSRRQVYRLLKSGDLVLRAKALGECLIDEPSVNRLKASTRTRQPLPAALAPLFPEYSLRSLNAGTDRDLVLARVVESGGEKAVAWALRRYGRPAVRSFVRRRGSSLSPRSLAFWESFLGVRALPGPAWRKEGPWRA
ncbi:MAG: hypothetical protein HYZ75_04805 [Elusimicrobia bacterium]|nr:hypothetical protein [Elusimicrobiota bacterium]